MVDPSVEDLRVAAAVAAREGWRDPACAPRVHPPRTLEEQAAVARLSAAASVRRPSRAPIGPALRVRLMLLTLSVVLLGVCWWVSPTRTALGLLVAGGVCVVAQRRRRTRARRVGPRAAGALWGQAPWGWGAGR